MLGRSGGSVARVRPGFAPVQQQQQPLFPRGRAGSGLSQLGPAGTIQPGLIRWDELPGSLQHESVAADGGFCSLQKV